MNVIGIQENAKHSGLFKITCNYVLHVKYSDMVRITCNFCVSKYVVDYFEQCQGFVLSLVQAL